MFPCPRCGTVSMHCDFYMCEYCGSRFCAFCPDIGIVEMKKLPPGDRPAVCPSCIMNENAAMRHHQKKETQGKARGVFPKRRKK